MNAERMREALADVPGALNGDDRQEPGWLSQAEGDLIVPAGHPTALDGEATAISSTSQVDAGGRYRREVEQERGVEALAWYRSFRIDDRAWGVYLRVDAIAGLSAHMFDGVGTTAGDRCRLALAAVLSHELAHFYIDAAVAQYELLSGVALWIPHTVEKARRHGYDYEEERIANAVMLRSMRTVEPCLRFAGREAALRSWTRTQPPGYCFGRHLTPLHKLEAALDRHGSNIAKPAIARAARRRLLRFSPLVLNPLSAGMASVPLYYVYGRRSMRAGDVGLFPAVRIVAESSAFKKQLSKAPASMARAYASLKSRLSESAPTPGARMQRWPKEGKAVWSLRLNSGDRVHLEHLDGLEFEAIAIGPHKAMGHGG